MKKIGTILIFMMLVGAVFLAGCTDTPTENGSTTPPDTEITLDEAIAILMGIIEPSSSEDRISAFMLTEPLRKTDTVKSEAGDEYPLILHPAVSQKFPATLPQHWDKRLHICILPCHR